MRIADQGPLQHGASQPALSWRAAAHVRAIDRALSVVYGTPVLQPDGDPLGGLVATILSQHTSDVNSERAYHQLRLKFPTWEAVRAAPPQEIADTIRCGGLARSKTVRILELLHTLQERRGKLDLSYLAELPPAAARRELRTFHGVGPKTAACVLLFHLGIPAFPVDTHVHRLSRRLGFADAGASPEAVQALVEEALPPDRFYPLHINLIVHGRTICKARGPRCRECALRALCAVGVETQMTQRGADDAELLPPEGR